MAHFNRGIKKKVGDETFKHFFRSFVGLSNSHMLWICLVAQSELGRVCCLQKEFDALFGLDFCLSLIKTFLCFWPPRPRRSAHQGCEHLRIALVKTLFTLPRNSPKDKIVSLADTSSPDCFTPGGCCEIRNPVSWYIYRCSWQIFLRNRVSSPRCVSLESEKQAEIPTISSAN